MRASLASTYYRITDRSRLLGVPDIARRRLRERRVGPLNGQQQRLAILMDIARAVPVDQVVETGTYLGTTTRLLAEVFPVPVDSVEVVPRFHRAAERRLAAAPSVTMHLGDSRSVLRSLPVRGRAFFYLDAHWYADMPLTEELAIIADRWSQVVVMIDDFQVRDDPGYGFDRLDNGLALTLDVLPHTVSAWRWYYPKAPASSETGSRRGCLVLAAPDVDLSAVGTLRRA